MLKKGLIYTCSNVNACSIKLLQKYFPSIYAKMKRTTISIKWFDNIEKECIRYVSIPIEMGGKMVHQKNYSFQVKLPSNLFLGRPWIHKIRVVTSTLHRSIKFMHKGKKSTIHVEENPTYVCQVVDRFWIPHDLVESEEDVPYPFTTIIP